MVMPLMLARVASLALLAGFLAPAVRAEIKFHSGPAQVALVELYTSEGCSSCPPAEKWLGELRANPGLWRQFVPVAFHVNYWDRLGWRDKLASKEFTDREYAYSAAWNSSSVYTPCFVRNGAEWRVHDGDPGTRGQAAAGELTLAWQDDGTCRLDYAAPAGASGNFEVSVALLGGGIVSNVRAGENSGRELRHEFVALRLAAAPLQRGEGGTFSATLTMPARPDAGATRRAIAAWVTKSGRLQPLQATGGWLE